MNAPQTATLSPDAPENPRAIPGSNQAPDYAQRVTAEMAANYDTLAASVTAMLAHAKTLPGTVESPEDSEQLSKAVKDMGDADDRAEAFRVREKEPYLRGGNAVDQFFKGLQDRLRKGRAILTARVHVYNEKRRIAEENRRLAELQKAREEADAAARKHAAEIAAQHEAEQAAARARKAENIEAHEQNAEAHAVNAEGARVEAMIAQTIADDARIASLQKPAEMVRERFDSGVLNTMAQKPHIEITDKMKLDKEKLWPFLKDADVLKALNGWAKTVAYKQKMDGAVIEIRAETVIR